MKNIVGRNIFIGLALCMIAVWLFGIFFMHKIGDHETSGCFAAVVQNTDCPQVMGVLEYIALHMSVFHVFSNSVFLDFIGALVLFFSLISLFLSGFVKSLSCLSFLALWRKNVSLARIGDYILRWCALHEKRDPLATT